MTNNKKAFVVEIEESYHRTVIVYAESAEEAENIAGALCDSEEIDLGRNCYAGRACRSSGPASAEDLADFSDSIFEQNGS